MTETLTTEMDVHLQLAGTLMAVCMAMPPVEVRERLGDVTCRTCREVSGAVLDYYEPKWGHK